jgi:cell wall-associated NlpC family hydrolase
MQPDHGDSHAESEVLMAFRGVGVLALALIALGTSACAPFQPGLPSDPVAREAAIADARGQGDVIARDARAQVGVPYRWGGSEPRHGFDCSGLVAYVHLQQGIAVPRTAAGQFAAARKVDDDELRPGDLVFFRLASGGREVSHVGVYTGHGRFVHAPQTGRDVIEASMDDPYYHERYAGAGRFYDESGGRGPRVKSPL